MSNRYGRCGSCEFLCLEDTGEHIQARCNKLIMPMGKGKSMGCERSIWYFGDGVAGNEKVKEIVQEKCNRLIAPIWCPLKEEA